MPGEIVDVLMMRESVVKAREREVRAFGDGWFRAVDAFRADPAGMARLMAAREEMTPAEVVAAFERVVLLDRAANRRLLGGSAPALVPALDDLARTMVDFRLIDTAPDVASLVTDTLVRGP
jgi:NitT/TauT family transport system substrate-binding protein